VLFINIQIKLPTLLDHEHNTRYKQNITTLLPNLNKEFGQKVQTKYQYKRF